MSEKDDLEFLKALRQIPSYAYKSILEPEGIKDNRKRLKLLKNLNYKDLSKSGKIDALIELGIPDNYPGLGRIDKGIISDYILYGMELDEDVKISTRVGRFLSKLNFEKLAQYVDNIAYGFKADPENVDAAGACGWITIPISIGMFVEAARCGVPLIGAAALTGGLLATSFWMFLNEVAQDGKKAKLLEGTDNLSKPRGSFLDQNSPS